MLGLAPVTSHDKPPNPPFAAWRLWHAKPSSHFVLRHLRLLGAGLRNLGRQDLAVLVTAELTNRYVLQEQVVELLKCKSLVNERRVSMWSVVLGATAARRSLTPVSGMQNQAKKMAKRANEPKIKPTLGPKAA